MSAPVVVLSWTLAGRTWRIGTRSGEADSTSGPIRIRGGLPTSDVDESIEIASSELSSSWSTDVIPPADIATLIDAQGHIPEAESAEVSVWMPGDAWEERHVVIQGRISEITWGPSGRRARITIDGDPSSQVGEWPPADAVIDSDTWTAPQANTMDQPYPWIVGRPGYYWRGGARRNVSGSPCYMIAGDVTTAEKYILIAPHLTDRRVESRWKIRDDTQDVESDYTDAAGVLEYDDGLGRRCTILQMSSTAGRADGVDAVYADGDDLYCQWTGSGGQIWDGGSLERAGDVLAWALQLSGLPMDWARTGAARGILPWELAGYWDQRCSAWDWTRDQLQPILPYSLRVGRDGTYPVVWPWWADASWAVDHIRQGQDVSVSPTFQRALTQPASSVQVRYARSASSGEYQEQVTLQADQPTGRGYSRTIDARAGRLWTAGEPRTVDADMVWSPTTAGLVSGWMAQYYMRRRSVYTVTGRYSRLVNIHLGDIVLLTLTDPAVSRRRGMVRRRAIAGGSITLEIVTW